ncbi:MAG: hypothetical protein NTZ83_03550 [Candidatus Pacearchaeota archaeon]|nr:hypothetical protein [Candidatus Pacearchaeota archaeon]
MRLLVKRDRNYLVETKGKAELDRDVPEGLSKVRVVPQSLVHSQETRNYNDDLLISKEQDYQDINGHFLNANNTSPSDALPGIWSGYRSVLVRDNESDRLFRLKGVSLNPDKPLIQGLGDNEYQVFGGQPKFAAEFEKNMSDKFNKVLEKEGIQPVMRCKGYWNYHGKIDSTAYSGSVVEVEGDTRLDELMLILEQFFRYRISANKTKVDENGVKSHAVNKDGKYVGDRISQLYHDIGFIVGGLKKLMDNNDQTWSADGNRSNAHIGNIVLYNGSEDVKTNFVDFDASCDRDDFSKSKIRELQKREYNTIINSAYNDPISLRDIQARFLGKDKPNIFSQLRDSFARGFVKGYDERRAIFSPPLTNTLPFERFLEIFEILRSGKQLTPESFRSYSDHGLENILNDFDPHSILSKNKRYQENLRNNYPILDKSKRYKDDLDNMYVPNKLDKNLDSYYGNITYGSYKKNLDDYL